MGEASRPLARPGLDVAAYIFSGVSLTLTAFNASLLLPGIGSGLYGGSALLVFMVLLLQLAGFILGLAVPALVQLWRGRFRMSRAAGALLVAALVGIIGEGLALVIIPATGPC